MGRWEKYSNSVKSSNNGKYIRLKDGDSVKFAVTEAEVGQRTTWWKDGQKVSQAAGAKESTKIVMGVYDVDQQAPRVLEITTATFRTLCEKIEEFGEDRIYRIKRYKDQKDFVAYAVDNIDRLDDAMKAKIAREPLLDILSEADVEMLEEAEEKPKEAPKPIPPKPRTATGKVSAMPAAAPVPDEDLPF